MIVETKLFKQACSKILSSIDSSSTISNVTDNLELIAEENILYLNVTNKEYYVSVKFQLNKAEYFKATVNAELFLKLISQTTTDNIEITLDINNINIKGNGKYKIPLIFEEDKIMELPKIIIDNITLTTTINKDILNSIDKYNSKEIIKENITKPIQKMYYLDELGCITFTGTGACVNNFNLNKPFKILLNNKLVKLFKLFKSDEIIFNLGYDVLSENIIQTKVCFSNDEVQLTSILSCDDSLINSVPVKAIRTKINNNYPYSIVLDKNNLNQSLTRLALFNKSAIYNYYEFLFDFNNLIISDENKLNIETLNYQNGTNFKGECYSLLLNINELKLILDGCLDQYITLLFGNKESLVIVRNNIKNLIMEYNKD